METNKQANIIEVKIDKKYSPGASAFGVGSAENFIGMKKDSLDEIRTQGMPDHIKDALDDVE